MSQNEKQKYKDLADEYNSKQNQKKPITQIITLQHNSKVFWNMYKALAEMIESIPNTEGKYYYIKLGLSSVKYLYSLFNHEENTKFSQLVYWI